MTDDSRQHPFALETMTDGELEERIAEKIRAYRAANAQTIFSLADLLGERARRAGENATKTMVTLTWAIGAMTALSTIFVVLSALHVVG